MKQEFEFKELENGEIEITKYTGISGDLVIPEEINGRKVTKIGAWAFFCNHLISVYIPDSVVEIGGQAFANNYLTSVVIPNSVKKIGTGAFLLNDELTSIVMPEGEIEVAYNAFPRKE